MRSHWKIDEVTDFACLTVNREVFIGSGAMPTAFHLKLGRYFREITGAPLCDGSLAVPFRGVGWFPAIR